MRSCTTSIDITAIVNVEFTKKYEFNLRSRSMKLLSSDVNKYNQYLVDKYVYQQVKST